MAKFPFGASGSPPRRGAAHRCGGGYGAAAALAEVKTPNQTLQQTAALLRWLRGIPSFEGRPLLNFGVRVRHLTLVQIALEELRHDNDVRVERPALSFSKG